MSFKYIDPGFGLSQRYDEDYGYGFYPPLQCLQSYTYNRKFGVAFYTEEDEYYLGSRVFFNTPPLTDFYVKFDEYFPESADSAQMILKNDSCEIIRISQRGANLTLRALNDETLELGNDDSHLKIGRVNTIWVHVETIDPAWRITLVINGERVFDSREGWSYSGQGNGTFRFNIDKALPVSNLIISDAEILLNETIVEVGNSAVETTMIEENGTYASAGAGDYVLQTLDPSSLYEQFRSDTKVSAILALAAPAYTTGDSVTTLKCRVVEGENVSDYKMPEDLIEMTESEFASLETTIPLKAQQIPVESDTTLADLSRLKIGWVTGV